MGNTNHALDPAALLGSIRMTQPDAAHGSVAQSMARLTPSQREAVECVHGPLLVIAGAGSGKTRVLTTRIAHLIADEGADPSSVLAITFTNKAAREMRSRLDGLGIDTRGLWACTFHSMCLRILRREATHVGTYGCDFTVYDDDDMRPLVRECAKAYMDDVDASVVKDLRARMSDWQDHLVLPDEVQPKDDDERIAAAVYWDVEDRLMRANAMSFDDLLMRCWQVLADPETGALEHWQSRFRHVSVDEYQDTNHAQYELVHLLGAHADSVMVVGDDDQSIYGWRGADVQNLRSFLSAWPNARRVTLEQNFRSTPEVCAAGNDVVCGIHDRMSDKRLIPQRPSGTPVEVHVAKDEWDEGRWVARRVRGLLRQGASPSDIAILYRKNVISRVLERTLLEAHVPARVYGGTSFLAREEVKDLMAYLRLAANPADDMAVQRVMNKPRRGVGDKAQGIVATRARAEGTTLLEACRRCAADASVTPKGRHGLADFVGAVDAIATLDDSLPHAVAQAADLSGIRRSLEERLRREDDDTEDVQDRIDDVDELATIAAEFEADPPEEALGLMDSGDVSDALSAFLSWVALTESSERASSGEDGPAESVSLMSVHKAKGLEWPHVFVCAMDEGTFPLVGDDVDTDEERRCAYVALTRAADTLTLTCAERRMDRGSSKRHDMSRYAAHLLEKGLAVKA